MLLDSRLEKKDERILRNNVVHAHKTSAIAVVSERRVLRRTMSIVMAVSRIIKITSVVRVIVMMVRVDTPYDGRGDGDGA